MTPLYKISLPASNTQIYAKLESQNPTGTHKDRSIGPWVEHYRKQGIGEFAIASSGNSAIAAVKYCTERGLKLHVFVSPHSTALPRLQKHINLRLTKTPRKDALQFCRTHKAINLRASTDDHALIGYKQIAYELLRQLPEVANIFIPTSSGATLEGINLGFADVRDSIPHMPAFYTIQTTKVHPIASYFDKNFTPEKTSRAKAIVDQIAHRKNVIIKICQETSGGGFVISNKELSDANKILYDLTYSAKPEGQSGGWQSALAFAGFLKWRKLNPKKATSEVSVCLFTD